MYGISSQRHITLLLAVGRECASSPLFSGKACLSAVSARLPLLTIRGPDACSERASIS
jgi:hypothetical protein